MASSKKRAQTQLLENYDSQSKRLHRQRIAEDMQSTRKGSSLLVLAAPNGADMVFYRSNLDPSTRIVGVNRASIAKSKRLSNCEYVTGEFGEVLAKSHDGEFTNVFYDSTANGVSMEDLYHARRVTTSKFYLTLSLSRMVNGSDHLLRAYKLRLNAAGFSISHVEFYSSKNDRACTMLFLVGEPTRPLPTSVPPEQVGNLVWTRCETPVPGLALISTVGGSAYIGVITSAKDGQFGIQFHDSSMSLARRCIKKPAKKGQVALSGAHTVPYLEYVDASNLARADMQRLRGAAR